MQVIFTRAGLACGMRASSPLLLGMAPFGLVTGVVSQQQGLSLAEALLMSALVFAGSAQLLALELWADPVPIGAVVLAAFAVNLRLAPMGPALAPWLDRLRGWRLWGTLATLVDHSFALAIAEQRRGGRDAAYLLGVGVLLWAAWLVLVGAGHVLGDVVRLPPGHPLFFPATAAFLSMLVPLWRGARHDLWPWVLAGVVALAAHRLGLPAPVPLLAGAFAGAALGAWLGGRVGAVER